MESNKITNADILAAFNKLKNRPYLATKDLLPSKAYKVLSMFRHKNKYGNVVMAEIEDGMLYLPKRYNNLEDKVIYGVSNEQFTLRRKLENCLYVLELEEVVSKNTAGEDEVGEFFIPNSQPYFSWENSKIPRNS